MASDASPGEKKDFRRKVPLGSTGLQVSRLGLASGYGVPAAAVERAYDEYGVNYFYWGSRRTGAMRDALRRLARRDRDGIVVALQTYDHLGPFMGRSVEKGLRALGLERVDVLILGWFNRAPGRRVLDAAHRLQERGLVRYLAMSGHNRRLFGEMAERGEGPVDIFMCRYNAAHRGAEEEIFPFLRPFGGPGVTVYTATRWGKLLDPGKMPPGESPLTASQCYRFVLTDPHVHLCMIGPRTEEEMLEGLRALQEGPLSPEEMGRARRVGDWVRGRGRGR